ncbi:aspartate aminotransferase family protein [Biformimicrobium ophioploci]|uniref:Acetylornithine aminotransferase n=1 Tax=Biformimicrobium ophioploci TaxID=3036711 RepID=A0ABQ6LZG3_9GAMM|nr:aspartate aminotransferase family protein [Microbulbifer sp. NKW57]GMG87432.1 aspartate aminotransferase family protein [Microbulbifer sp. NKW57]
MPGTALMNTYGERKLTLVRGKGHYVWDDRDQRYFDGISGIGVCGLGHCHPAVAAAVAEQAKTLLHTSNLYLIPAQKALAERLSAISGMDNTFFSNSGAEANEAAIKLALRHGHNRGLALPRIVVMEGAFHGRTFATLTATANAKVRDGFGALPENFIRAPFNDVAALEKLAAEHEDIVAILLEPIQGEGGIGVPDPGYIESVRQVCDQSGWLMMLDEVQTGNGRTGRYFAYQHSNILPDVVTTAKGLGNGVPIGACLARGQAAALFGPGSHGSTYGGNPLACSAGLAVLDTIESEVLIENAEKMGALLAEKLREKLVDNPAFVEVRGKGLMIGIELTTPCPELVDRARERGLLLNVTAGNVIRLLPPLTLKEQDCEFITSTVAELVVAFAEETN